MLARGVDTQLFNPERRSTVLRQQWGADKNTRVVAIVGRLAAEKNLDLAIFAFDELRRTAPNSLLLFVGDGPQKSALAARHPEHIFAGMRLGWDAIHDAFAGIVEHLDGRMELIHHHAPATPKFTPA
ncbi:MAG: glycosyltransferase [Rhodocyclaceae bacterium]|nr:glycosyltransferase [Rhodocyclaceae bacterium]